MRIWDRLFGKNRTETSQENEEKTILCIDGGGMRGIVPLAVIRKFEKLLNENGFNKGIANAFDMIAGTSTGGLISLCLSFKENIDLDQLTESYLTLGKKIFPSSSLTRIMALSSSKYPSTGIESVLKQWFKDKKLSEAIVPTLITSYDLSEGKPVMFKSWENKDITVSQAARATSAAPTYFAPLIIGKHIYVDGGVVANNPSVYAYYEAKKLWPNCKKFTILSLSTAGTYHTMTVEQTNGLLNWVTQISPMYSTAQKRTCDYVLENCPEVEYIRIDEQAENHISLDETNPDILSDLVDLGNEIASDNIEKLNSLAKRIAQNHSC